MDLIEQLTAVQSLTHPSSVAPNRGEIERANRSAYTLIAPEYDDPNHRTTRALERATLAAWRRVDRSHISTDRVVLEVGCGTGTLSSVLNGHPQFCATDVTTAMIAVASRKLPSVRFAELNVFAPGWPQSVHTLIAGLADPYLVPEALQALWSLIEPKGLLFVTVPEQRWATQERSLRLCVPAHKTRFRLRTGVVVEPYSFVYSVVGLQELLQQNRFELIDVWEEMADVDTTTEPLSRTQQASVRVACAIALRQ